jgi:hypothetical protein
MCEKSTKISKILICFTHPAVKEHLLHCDQDRLLLALGFHLLSGWDNSALSCFHLHLNLIHTANQDCIDLFLCKRSIFLTPLLFPFLITLSQFDISVTPYKTNANCVVICY